MRAVEYDAYGGIERMELRDVAPPEPGRDRVVVRVRAAALNPKDALFRKGRFRVVSGGRFPKRAGLDFAGEVIASGSPRFSPGQRVFGALAEWTFARGTLAEVVSVRPHEAAPLPDEIDFGSGAAVALTALTSLQALRDVARVGRGSEVAIHGASGGVGTAAIQIARVLGARVTTFSSARNLELCRSLGAVEALDYEASDLAALDRRFDCFFDVYGNRSRARVGDAIKPGGTFVSTVPTPGRIVRDLVSRALPMRERLVVVRSVPDDLALIAGWLRTGELVPVIDSRFPLERYAGAFRVLESRRARGKVVVDVD
jgi:NADPH:quinone reductase-like Zn-dependent oxidoreductase